MIFNLFVGAALFLLFNLRFWLASLNKPLWTDEVNGIHGASVNSFYRLFEHGPNGEASPSPLHYVIEKIWIAAWNHHPEYWWNMRLFFRILPVLYWSIACTALFFFLLRFIPKKIAGLKLWQITLLSAAVAGFVHSNEFAAYYSIEDRAYALWLMFSTLQILFILDFLAQEWSARKWMAFGVLCFCMSFAAYISLLQTGLLGLLMIGVGIYRNNKMFSWQLCLKPAAVVLFSSTVSLYYYLQVVPLSYGKPWFMLYWTSVMEVVSKSFHNHGWQSTLLVFPLCFFGMPYVLRKNYEVKALAVYSWILLFSSYLLYLACYFKGNLFASRYLMYLVPTQMAMYLLTLALLFHRLAAFLSSRWGGKISFLKNAQTVFIFLLFTWSIFDVLGRASSSVKVIVHDWHYWEKYQAYSLKHVAACPPNVFVETEAEFEKINSLCREI